MNHKLATFLAISQSVTENHPPATPQKLTPSLWSKDREDIIRQMRVCSLVLIPLKRYIFIKLKEDRKELLKQRREMKELEHQQQKKFKIAMKAFNENIAEKNMIIKELQEHIEDKDEIIETLKNSRDASRFETPACRAYEYTVTLDHHLPKPKVA